MRKNLTKSLKKAKVVVCFFIFAPFQKKEEARQKVKALFLVKRSLLTSSSSESRRRKRAGFILRVRTH